MDSSDTPPPGHDDGARLEREVPPEDARKLARVPLALVTIMGAFLVLAAIVSLLIWAL